MRERDKRGGQEPLDEAEKNYWDNPPEWLDEETPPDDEYRLYGDEELAYSDADNLPDSYYLENGEEALDEDAPIVMNQENSVYDTLNPEQKAAASVMGGSCLVLAGPGTGKTRTITGRVEHLVREGVAPSRILVMTFTKKAARELTERLRKVSPAFARVRAGTFHSVAIGILREELGGSRVVPYDDKEERAFMNDFFRQRFGLGESDSPMGDDWLLHAFYRANHELGVSEPGRMPKIFHQLMDDMGLFDGAPSDQTGTDENIEAVNEEFYRRLEKANGGKSAYSGLSPEDAAEAFFRDFNAHKKDNCVYSFDDCIVAAAKILKSPAGAKYRRRYDYVSVDEFQDTDIRQTEMVRGLVMDHGNIFAVGDGKQAIYAWRGAYSGVFDDFRRSYSPRIIELVRNYRSTDAILAAVNTASRILKDSSSPLSGQNGPGVTVLVDEPWSYCEPDTAARIAERIGESKEPLSEIAVLVRSHAKGVSNDLQGFLAARQIPFEVVGGMKLSDRVLFKNIRHVMRLVEAPEGMLPWQELAKGFPGIGKAAASQVANMAVNVARETDEGSGNKLAAVSAALRLSRFRTAAVNAGVATFCDFLDRISGFDNRTDPAKIIDAVGGVFTLAYLGMPYKRIFELADSAASRKSGKVSKDVTRGGNYIRPHAGFQQDLVTALRDFAREMDESPQGSLVKASPKKKPRTDRAAVEAAALSVPNQLPSCAAVMNYADLFCHNAKTPGKWLDNLAFDEPAKDEDEKRERVTISTIHSAKGREWGEVHVPDLCENIFPTYPLMRSIEAEASRLNVGFGEAAKQSVAWAEEKNLLYVALSRAKRSLSLYSCEDKPSLLIAELREANAESGAILKSDGTVWGGHGKTGQKPSF